MTHFHKSKNNDEGYLLGLLFLISKVDKRIVTTKSGRIIQVGNSGTVGVELGLGAIVGANEDTGVDVGLDNGFWGGNEGN